MKRVPSQSRFVLFGYHNAVYQRERKREREQKETQHMLRKGKKERTYTLKMHEHVM